VSGDEPVQPEPMPPRRARWRRILLVVAAGITVLALTVAGGADLLYRHYNGQITRVGIRLSQPPSPPSTATPASSAATDGASTPTPPDDGQNFLLMGSDSRDFVGGQAYNADPNSPSYVTGQRSDVVILLHLPSAGSQATVVSFPRDSWVELPGYVDDKGVTHSAVHAKLNAAFALGGAPLLVATIENLTGLHIDHFASVNFPGFKGMVNALGGVDVCIGTSRHDASSGDFLTAGHHHLNGAQALALVRDRESFPDQDLGRIRDQEYFLSVMVHKVFSAGTLTNPLKLNAFLNVATKSLTVDQDMSLGDMRDLASRFAHLDSADIDFETVPVADGNYQVTSSVYGGQPQSAVELAADPTAQLFASLRGEPAAPRLSAGATPGSTAASEVPGPAATPTAASNLTCAP
jgi:LCP family protein required for cell wall assembly